MKWDRQGLIFAPDGSWPWARTHAMCPTPLLLSDDVVRIYYAGLDADMFGRIGYIDVASENPAKILKACSEPILDLGERGCFDDCGVVPVTAVKHPDGIFLYYFGFQRSVQIRYLIFSGLAVSDSGGTTFTRAQQVPVLDRSDGETLLRSAPSVLHDPSGEWQMWYVAGDRHILVGDKERPTYEVRYIRSPDGRNWPRHGEIVVKLDDPDEYGFGRPHVVKGRDKFHMWYSLRRKSIAYRIGYADSPDGIRWTRHDADVGIDVSANGWDSEMVYAAAVLETRHGTYMFYNGNDHGRTGFGYARLDGAL